MSEEIPMGNPPPSFEEEAAIARLKESDLQVVESAILANTFRSWSKVAAVVVMTEKALRDRYPDVSYIFYAKRLIRLAEEDRLESQGHLEHMRFSEVRLPARANNL